jgi:hypothetical protein
LIDAEQPLSATETAMLAEEVVAAYPIKNLAQ